MGLFSWLFGGAGECAATSFTTTAAHDVNPANGMPMANAALDVFGNTYGSDASTSFCSFDSYSPTFDFGSCFDHSSRTDY